MSIEHKTVIDAAVKLPELRQDAGPATSDAPKPSKRGGLLIGFGMIILLTLLVYLNMG